MELFVPPEPFDEGLLEVEPGEQIAWSIRGSPDGVPAVILHGGPGQGSAPSMARALDPKRFRVVLYDQRGCGRSTPSASDPKTSLARNTTPHLVADLEALRQHLGLERWLVSGASWGSTLALAYAEAHPHRVSALVISAVTLSDRAAWDWLYGGLSRFFPEAHAAFLAHVGGSPDPVSAYAARLDDPDPSVRLAAARAWCAWEDTVVSLEPHALRHGVYSEGDDAELVGFVRICAHYARNSGFVDGPSLLEGAAKLGSLPGVIIHGRHDLGCPIETAVSLAARWPGAELVTLPDAGHMATHSSRAALVRAFARFEDAERP